MRGLNKLRNYAKGYKYKIVTDDELNSFADEIEQDMKENSFYVSFERFARSIGKPIEESPILNIHEWLNYWYLPRPVIDGEPVQFGDKFEYGGSPMPVSGFYIFSDRTNQLFIDTGNNCAYIPRVTDAKRAKSDSIEKLKEEIAFAIQFDEFYEGYTKEDCERMVDDWFKRAEKLFKDDAE